jgi:putative oxidoreductase
MTPIDFLFLTGRLLLGGYFVAAAIGHFTKHKMMAGYAASKGVPLASLAIPGTGLLLLGGGLSVLLGLYPLVGLGLLALFLVGVTPTMHDFWKETDPMQRMAQQTHFMKNAALLGAVLALSVLGSTWPYALHL